MVWKRFNIESGFRYFISAFHFPRLSRLVPMSRCHLTEAPPRLSQFTRLVIPSPASQALSLDDIENPSRLRGGLGHSWASHITANNPCPLLWQCVGASSGVVNHAQGLFIGDSSPQHLFSGLSIKFWQIRLGKKHGRLGNHTYSLYLCTWYLFFN